MTPRVNRGAAHFARDTGRGFTKTLMFKTMSRWDPFSQSRHAPVIAKRIPGSIVII
jgi:hypothetical protein